MAGLLITRKLQGFEWKKNTKIKPNNVTTEHCTSYLSSTSEKNANNYTLSVTEISCTGSSHYIPHPYPHPHTQRVEDFWELHLIIIINPMLVNTAKYSWFPTSQGQKCNYR